MPNEPMPERRAHRARSVRTHLAAIVIVVVIVFIGVGAALGRQTWTNARSRVQADADYMAAFAADMLTDSATLARQQVNAVAANPGALAPLVQNTGCSLQFDLAIFPGSHLDLVRPDGSVACSSATLHEAGASDAGAAWIDVTAAQTRPVTSIFTDGVTGEEAVAIVAPINDADGHAAGHVAVVIPTKAIAPLIAETYGGRRQFQFTLLDSDDRIVLSASHTGGSASAPMPGFISTTVPVSQTTWSVAAGVDPGMAMAPTRSVLLRGLVLGGAVMLVLVGAMAVVNRRIGRPLRTLTDTVHDGGPRLAESLDGFSGPAEVERLAEAFRATITDRDTYEAQLAHVALHDPLTGLANRALLLERLNDRLATTATLRNRLAVLFVDLDRFKLINDSLGHEVGDVVLIEIARRLHDLVSPNGILARFGGDEFVLVVDIVDDRQLENFVESLLTVITDPIDTPTSVVRTTASVGVATSVPGRRATDLIRDADNAMYAAKEGGRGRAHRFTRRLHDRAASRLAIATEFRGAMDRGEFTVAYQPKVDLATGDVVGVESLVRWNHPALGAVPPSTFIPIAEESDAIIRLGQWVLEEVSRQAMEWREDGLDMSVAVNVSGRQLTNGGLPLQVATTLALFGLPPEQLYLELTETLLMTDTLVTQRSIDELAELGVRLSIDDFGTGYSSLAYLHRFRVDELKIDRTFVSDLTVSAHARPLVAAMVAMGNAFGLEVVAEGVETTLQAEQLRELGCQRGQGFLYARPMPAAAISAMLRTPAGVVRAGGR